MVNNYYMRFRAMLYPGWDSYRDITDSYFFLAPFWGLHRPVPPLLCMQTPPTFFGWKQNGACESFSWGIINMCFLPQIGVFMGAQFRTQSSSINASREVYHCFWKCYFFMWKVDMVPSTTNIKEKLTRMGQNRKLQEIWGNREGEICTICDCIAGS